MTYMFLVCKICRLKVHEFTRLTNGFHDDPGEWAVVASDAPLGWRSRGTTTGLQREAAKVLADHRDFLSLG